MGKKYIQPVRGTHDLIGDEMRLFRHIVEAARNVAERFGYNEMQTPIFEFSEVFHRSLGDMSDVVSKETYTFDDRGGESLTLRPEFTAAIVRAFISNGYTQKLPFKAFYNGPAFRYERPQKGRQRQFHQIGVECLGATEPAHDAQCIACAYAVLNAIFGADYVKSHVTLEINTLGDAQSRMRYRNMLVDYLGQHKEDLSADSQLRLEKNPLRILDSKDKGDRAIIANAPSMQDAFTTEATQWFADVAGLLDDNNITYTPSPRLVRGLDYYTHTVFEFTTDKLGAQATLLAGGRYNGLVQQLGGPDIPGVGWAAGVERLMLLAADAPMMQRPDPARIMLAASSKENQPYMFKVALALRSCGIIVEESYKTNISKAAKEAHNWQADYFAVLGDDELANNTLSFKAMQDALQSVTLTISAVYEAHKYVETHTRPTAQQCESFLLSLRQTGTS